jgi:pimeloyl-ACP methyl ester carboxylesterase
VSPSASRRSRTPPGWSWTSARTDRLPHAIGCERLFAKLEIRIPDEDLADLDRRLAATRYIEPPPGADRRAGVPVEYLREVLDHWRHRFDWSAVEERIDGFANLRVDVDGLALHAVHVRSPSRDAVPIVLVHGWPSSFVELLDLAEELALDEADPFHVVVPSLPGFGFSESPRVAEWDAPEDGEAIAKLMRELGYERFAVHTHDIGASVMRVVLVEQPERIVGYHTTEPGIPGPFPRPERESMSEEERAQRDYAAAWHADEGGYVSMLTTRPLTIAHGLNDSPAGLAAWILEKWWSWTVPPGSGRTLDEFLSLDQVLANVALYWHTRTISSANWPYYRPDTRQRTAGEQAHVPVGVALTTQPIERAPRAWAERFFPDIRSWVELGRGGHFVAMEEPALLANAIRDFVRPLRGT